MVGVLVRCVAMGSMNSLISLQIHLCLNNFYLIIFEAFESIKQLLRTYLNLYSSVLGAQWLSLSSIEHGSAQFCASCYRLLD